MSKIQLLTCKNINPARLVTALLLLSALASGCLASPAASPDAGDSPTVEVIPAQPTTDLPPTETVEPTQALQLLVRQDLDYCFAFPAGSALLVNGTQVEIIWPYDGSGPQPGMVWIYLEDPQGRSAGEIAQAEVDAFGGTPPQSTVTLGGEEALVLDGMPGQDPIRKVYIVHNGALFTLNFSPSQAEDPATMDQVNALFDAITSSWVWISSGAACPPGS